MSHHAKWFRCVAVFPLVISIITMGVGLSSHYGSIWSYFDRIDGDSGDPSSVEHQHQPMQRGSCDEGLCEYVFDISGLSSEGFYICYKCPDIKKERFFIAMNIISVVGALLSCALSLSKASEGIVLADTTLNIILGVLNLAASYAYIASAVQIHVLADISFRNAIDEYGIKERYDARIAAVCYLGVLNQACCGFLSLINIAVATARGYTRC